MNTFSQIADISTVLDHGIEKALVGFQWPIPHQRYDAASVDLINILVSEYAGTNDNDIKAILTLRVIDLVNELNPFLACIIEAAYGRNNNVNFIYSDQSPLYEMVSKNQFVNRYFWAKRMGEYYSHNDGWLGIRGVRNHIRRALLRANNFIGFTNTYRAGSNLLLQESASGLRLSLEPILSSLRRFPSEYVNPPSRIFDFADHLSSTLGQKIKSHTEWMTDEAMEYLKGLVRYYLATAHQDLKTSPSLRSPSDGSRLLAATGGNYASRLISHVFQSSGRPVIRFTHGGDRAIYDDWLWGLIELSFTDVYVSHGTKEAFRIKERQEKQIIPMMNDAPPKITASGSKFHANLAKFADVRSVGLKPKTIMVSASSFTGPIKQIPGFKVHDLVYVDWQKRLLGMLKTWGYHVIQKRHPKGVFPSVPILDPYCDEEIITGTLPQHLHRADSIIFDFAGGGFVEALCSMKHVVLIDIPIRPFNSGTIEELRQCCEIVPASFDERNRIIVEEEVLQQALEAPINIDARTRFIEDYYISRSPDFDENTRIFMK